MTPAEHDRMDALEKRIAELLEEKEEMIVTIATLTDQIRFAESRGGEFANPHEIKRLTIREMRNRHGDNVKGLLEEAFLHFDVKLRQGGYVIVPELVENEKKQEDEHGGSARQQTDPGDLEAQREGSA